MNFFFHFPDALRVQFETVTPADLANLNQKLDNLTMKVSQALAALDAAKTQLTKASGEILAKIEELKNSDPDLSPEGQATVEGITNIAQALDNVVPDAQTEATAGDASTATTGDAA